MLYFNQNISSQNNMQSQQIMDYLYKVFSGWRIIKQNLTDQRYEIPREGRTSRLSTKVLSFVVQKETAI